MIPPPLAWALAHIRAGRGAHRGPVPRYGSAAWAALPESSAARWAAVVLAAEAWRTDEVMAVEQLESERLGAYLDAERAADERWSVEAGDVRRKAGSPTYAQLQARRSGAS